MLLINKTAPPPPPMTSRNTLLFQGPQMLEEKEISIE